MQYHPGLSEQQKENLCELIDIQKLTREVCRDVALNEKLPLRVVVKVLFIELLHLKTSLEAPRTETETLSETELATETGIRTGTGTEINNVRRWGLFWQKLKLHSKYEEILKKLSKRVEKAKEAKKNWKLISCKNFGLIMDAKALPAPREQKDEV